MLLTSRRRKLVPAAFAVAALAALGAIAVPHTFGRLDASSSNAANAITEGTLSVTTTVSGAVVTMTNAKPGGITCGAITVTNSGSLPGQFELSESNVTGNHGTGTLGRALQLHITQDPTAFTQATCAVSGGSSVYSGAFDSVASVKLTGSASSGTGRNASDWAPGESHQFVFVVTFPGAGSVVPSPGATPPSSAADNAYQAQTVSAEMDWYGTQSRASVVSHS